MNNQFVYRKPGASRELKLFLRSIRLLPRLARRGVPPVDALAIAYNATFLFYSIPRPAFVFSPGGILARYPLSEIARLCEEIADGAEYGTNKNFKESLP